MQQRHLRLSHRRQLRVHVWRTPMPRPVQREQRDVRRGLRQRNLLVRERQQLQLQLQGAALSRQLFGGHDLQWHLLQWQL